MNYLQDRRPKKNKFLPWIIVAILALILLFFHSGIYRVLSYTAHLILRPVISIGGSVGSKISSLDTYFKSKNSLEKENAELRSEIDRKNALVSNYDTILGENEDLKEILGRKNERANLTLSGILSKPDRSAYDTLLIDAGNNLNIEVGDRVFALGNVPIGRVAEVYPWSSKVLLFSSPGERTEGVIAGKNVFVDLVGRGGGNFEIILPRDLMIEKGTEITLPGVSSYTLAIVSTIISDPRDAYQKALLVSPVNIQELKFVEVE